MSTTAPSLTRRSADLAVRVEQSAPAPASDERCRARRYPFSRWYLRPAADRLAALLVSTPVRPVHLTGCGLLTAVAAGVVLGAWPDLGPLAGLLVLGTWFFDRADGLLARRQGTVSAWGAWLDANVDELVDVGLHVAVAATVAHSVAADWPWLLVIAFLAGKYLFMYGLNAEEDARENNATGPDDDRRPEETMGATTQCWLRTAWHLPGNADVRIHLLAAALMTGCLATELVLVAVYYNLRWTARYLLVARRLGGAR